MTLVLHSRTSTKDVDAVPLKNAAPLRDAAAKVATLRDELDLKTVEDALAVVERYVPTKHLTIKTQLTIESLFE